MGIGCIGGTGICTGGTIADDTGGTGAGGPTSAILTYIMYN